MNNIELYIGGMKVVLSEAFETTVVEENPLLTKSGAYTYDIDIDLANKTNARIYKHINRFNSEEWITNRRAILIENNRVKLDGIEAIIDINESSVKIQLLSGNAELNFLGSTALMSEMALGTIPTIDETMALATLTKFYGDTDYIFPTIMEVYPTVMNATECECFLDTGARNLRFITGASLVPQPYLLYYVNKLPEVLGFSVVENVLNTDDLFKRIYICNARISTNFSDLIPTNWTANDFISAVERMCAVTFVIDKVERTVRILHNSAEAPEVVQIDRVIDEFKRTIDLENNIDALAYDYVSYDLPNNNYYRYADLSDEAESVGKVVTFASFTDLVTEITTNPTAHNDQKEILTTPDNEYIFAGSVLKRVNMLKGVGNNLKNKITLKFIPCQITTDEGSVATRNEPLGWFSPNGLYQLPNLSTTYANEVQTFAQIIESGLSKADFSADVIPISIYLGLTNNRDESTGDYITDTNFDPISTWSQNDSFLAFGTNVERYNYVKGSLSPSYKALTLRLDGANGLYQRLYSDAATIDVRQKYEIDFPLGKEPNPRAEFMIRNKRFMCEKLEYKVSTSGAAKTVRGYFYPIL